ncbi:MAG: biopolymer transporter ExbD [Deltaproteobacteria bacterium]|nr:biopolymer transporter ExbD [Deltaproteobacteria bacterium]
MFDEWRRTVQEAEEPNLIPVMNLMMTLIPMLLLGASFFHMAVIPTSTSQLTANQSDVPKTPTQVAMNLMVEPDRMRLTASSVSLDEDTLAALGATLPVKAGGTYDLDALAATLAKVKDAYPASTTLLVFPHDGLAYQTLVEILDRTREREVQRPGRAKPEPEPLFPVTVFNKLVPEPPPEPDEEAAPGDGVEGAPGDDAGGAAVDGAPAADDGGGEGAP